MNMKLTSLVAGTILAFSSFYALAAENHLGAAIEHAEAAAKASSAGNVTEHAEAAEKAAKESQTHLNAGIERLNDAIEHGKAGHTDMAKKSAGQAVEHLKAAQ
jgi:hypothetical protein